MVNLLGESSLFVEKGNCISVYPNRSHDFIFLRGFGSSDIKGICNGKSAFQFKKHFISLKSNSKDATEKLHCNITMAMYHVTICRKV